MRRQARNRWRPQQFAGVGACAALLMLAAPAGGEPRAAASEPGPMDASGGVEVAEPVWGAVDGDGVSASEPKLAALRSRFGDRIADISVAPDRNGFVVSVVGLAPEDTRFIVAQSTNSIYFEAAEGVISESALVEVAEDIVNSGLLPEGFGVGVDTAAARITVATPAPLSGRQQDAIRTRGVEALSTSQVSRSSSGPLSEVLQFVTATTTPLAPNPSDFRASNPMRGGSWLNPGGCTGSFLLQSGSQRRFLTAAHCTSGANQQIRTYNNTHVGYVSAWGVGGFDVETFTMANHDDVSAIHHEPNNARLVSQVISTPVNGQRRCFVGLGSVGQGKDEDRCSTQGQIWYSAPIPSLPTRGYRCINGILAPLGDSGGPVYDIRSDEAAIAVGVVSFRIDQSGIGGVKLTCYTPIADVLASLPGWSVRLTSK